MSSFSDLTNVEQLAEAQLLGFAHSQQGFDLASLLSAMALKKEEWVRIKEATNMVPDKMKQEIDEWIKRNG